MENNNYKLYRHTSPSGKVYSRTRGKFINIHQAGGYIWKYKGDVIWENQ